VDSNGDFNLPNTRTWFKFDGYVGDFPFEFGVAALVDSTVSIQRTGPGQWIVKSPDRARGGLMPSPLHLHSLQQRPMDLQQLQAMGGLAPGGLVRRDISIKRPPLKPKEEWASPDAPESDESAPMQAWTDETLTIHIRKRSAIDFYELGRCRRPAEAVHGDLPVRVPGKRPACLLFLRAGRAVAAVAVDADGNGCARGQ
jgi:hypothetical protein